VVGKPAAEEWLVSRLIKRVVGKPAAEEWLVSRLIKRVVGKPAANKIRDVNITPAAKCEITAKFAD